MKFPVVLAISLGILAGSAAAEDLEWFSNQNDSTTALVYGVKDSDDTPIVFNCDKGDDLVRLFATHDSPTAKDGQRFEMKLTNGAAIVTIAATGRFQEMDDLVHLEATAKLDQKLVDILSKGETLELSVEGKAQKFPLAGAAEHIGALVAACGAPLDPLDLELKITNDTKSPVVSFLFSEQGVNDFDGDTYGNYKLNSGATTHMIIPKGKKICAFDLRAEFSEEAERDPFEARQNLCENAAVVIAD